MIEIASDLFTGTEHDRSKVVADHKFLTDEEVAERYRGQVSVGTLRNWRSARVGPPFVKVGKAVLYPVDALDAWDKKNLVICRDASRSVLTELEQG